MSLIKSNKVTAAEKYLGYLLGPFSIMLLNSILTNYLNVYYTDVLNLSDLWDGMFLTTFPLVVKAIDAFTFVIMGIVVEKVHFKTGKARPWILISAPLLVISMIMLFAVPQVSDVVTIIWIFVSYNLFYSVAYTIYNTAHVLMIPLSTKDDDDRRSLSVISNCQGMLAGSLVAVFFPTFVLPEIDTDISKWVFIMVAVALAAFPFILMEFFFTRERVTESEENNQGAEDAVVRESFASQLKNCFKSKRWVLFMIFLICSSVVNNISSHTVFYYCNWVLGTYNDGITQMLYYTVGNAPIGLGLFLARPIAKKIGVVRSIIIGYIVAAVGTFICILYPYDIKIVLAGQLIKSVGIIQPMFLQSSLLASSLDDVKTVSGKRADGASSAVYNVIHTVTVGLSLFVLNFGLAALGYIAPEQNAAMVQPEAVQNFFIVLTYLLPLILYPAMTVLFYIYGKTGGEVEVRQRPGRRLQ